MDSLTLALVIIAILIVLCFWLLVLLERTSERASIARMESARMEGDRHTIVRLEILLRQALQRNEDLVGRITGMMREGFVEIPQMEPDEEGDASESGEKWPPLSAQEYRDSTGHWPPEEERHWSLHQS